MKLLANIAFHYDPERLKYLEEVVANLKGYDIETTVLIHCNEIISVPGAINILHKSLKHPFHLTWVPREHIKKHIDEFDYFLYTESDMLLPYENFIEYTQNFKDLWPQYVPSFIRIEKFDGKEFITDMTEPQKLGEIITINGKRYTTLNKPYHAFWLMPQKELKESMRNFDRREDSREYAASYPMWELRKTPLVRLTDDNKIHPLCYSYHLPNNYALSPETPFAKVEVDKIWI